MPLDLRNLIGRVELKKSLQTPDSKNAKTAATILIAKAEQFFFRARTGVMTERELEILAAELIAEFTGSISEHKQNRKDSMDWLFSENGSFPPADMDLIDTTLKTPKVPSDVVQITTWYAHKIEQLEQEIATEFFSRSTRNWARQLVREKNLSVELPPVEWFSEPGYKLPAKYDAEIGEYILPEEATLTPVEAEAEQRAWNSPAPPAFNAICLTLLQAQIDAYQHELERAQGKRSTPFQAQIAARIQAAIPRPKLSELWGAYSRGKLAKNKWNPRTAENYERFQRELTSIIGDRELADYREEDAFKIIETLTARENEPNTISGKVEFLSSLFKFALKTPQSIDKWQVRGNPFADMQVESNGEPTIPRVPYTHDDLVKLLTGLTKIRKRVEPHRFWVPLVALYTGARQGDVCQLRTDDIVQDDKIHVIHIRHNPGLRQETKSRCSRTCPVHPMLKKLGFLDFVEEQRKNNHDRLFHTLSYTAGKKWSGRIRTWWNETFQKKMLEDTAGKSFHSLRKSFVDWFKQHQMYDTPSDRSVVQSMIGHDEDLDVTGEHYETEFPAKTQYRMLVKLDYGFPADLIERLKEK